jgi:acetylornithine deacetylase/succinyl-diaminopimelate desuccinylase-like protein
MFFRTQKGIKDLATTRGAAEALRRFTRERAEINDLHLALCRIPAPTFFEEKRGAFCIEKLAGFGYSARLDRAGNVVATLPADAGKPLVAVTAHLDTVLAPRIPEEIRLAPDGRFLGPGVADNGPGVTALLVLAQAYAQSAAEAIGEQRRGLVFVANVGEEGEGNLSGMRYLCRQSALASQIESYVVLDGPGSEHITAQALASRRFEILFQGPGGHSWSDAANPNAIHALSRTICDFLDCQQRRAGFMESRYGRASAGFTLIDGGTSINSIPTAARAKLDLRSESGEVLNELAELLTDCVERALVQENDPARPKRGTARMTAKIREIGSRPAGRLPESSPLLAAILAVDEYLGIPSRRDCASTDANIPLSMGLEAICVGCGGSGGGAHTDGEWFHPEGRDLGLKRIYLTLLRLLRD